MSKTALEAAYRRAIYRVYPHRRSPADAIDLHIGRRSAALDRLLAQHGATTWSFLTATNPASRRLSAAENHRRTRNLAATLARRRWRHFRGEEAGGPTAAIDCRDDSLRLWVEPPPMIPDDDVAPPSPLSTTMSTGTPCGSRTGGARLLSRSTSGLRPRGTMPCWGSAST